MTLRDVEIERIARVMHDFLSCRAGHDWRFIGGRNCGCDDGACSLSVHECRVCGECDYGDNDEAAQIKRDCKTQR